MDIPAPTLLINAGGASRRMGTPKALLPTPGAGEPLILHIARRLLPLAGDLLVVANDPAVADALSPLPVRWLVDAYPDAGPLGGLATALAVCNGWALCVACDLPFVQPKLVRQLIALCGDGWDAVVPRVNGRAQPLHALYHRRCLPAVEAALQTGRRRMDTFFPEVRVRWVEEEAMRPYDKELRSFVNVNTPEEWRAARQEGGGNFPEGDDVL